MYKITTIPLLLVISVMLISCQPVLRMITGTKKPKLESIESLNQFLVSNDLIQFTNEKKIWVLRNEDSFRNTFLRIQQLPYYSLVTPEGKVIKRESYCFDAELNEFDLIIANEINRQYEDYHIKQVSEAFITSDSLVLEETLSNEKYSLLIYWAKFMPKSLVTDICKISETARSSENDIDIYLLNMDVTANWESN